MAALDSQNFCNNMICQDFSDISHCKSLTQMQWSQFIHKQFLNLVF